MYSNLKWRNILNRVTNTHQNYSFFQDDPRLQGSRPLQAGLLLCLNPKLPTENDRVCSLEAPTHYSLASPPIRFYYPSRIASTSGASFYSTQTWWVLYRGLRHYARPANRNNSNEFTTLATPSGIIRSARSSYVVSTLTFWTKCSSKRQRTYYY